MTETKKTATRYNTKRCKACGTVTSVRTTVRVCLESHPVYGLCELFATESGTAVLVSNGAAVVRCRGCGGNRLAQPVRGLYRVDKKCDGRCEAATGFSCECQCGGKNHGMSHAA
jgi:hypothetical protein